MLFFSKRLTASYEPIAPASLDDRIIDGRDEKILEVVRKVSGFFDLFEGAGMKLERIDEGIYDGSVESVDRIVSAINKNMETIRKYIEKATSSEQLSLGSIGMDVYIFKANKAIAVNIDPKGEVKIIGDDGGVAVNVTDWSVSNV